MKIGITGTGCSGKTTLTRQLAKYFNFNVIEEMARKCNKDELHNAKNEKIQYDLAFDQIKNEMLSKGNIITDRIILDPYIYLERRGHKPRMHFLRLILHWLETYDIIFLCKKLPFIDDGFRENDLNVEDDLRTFLRGYRIEYDIIEGNESERFEKARKIIEQRSKL